MIPVDTRCEEHGLVYVIEGDRWVCPLCESVNWAARCEVAARALDHQAAHEVVNAMAARLRGKAQGLRLAVAFFEEAHQSGTADLLARPSSSDEKRAT
jgi:hypothetical protein